MPGALDVDGLGWGKRQRQLRLVRRSLDEDAAHALVRALIHSRLDYCNGVLANSTMEKFGRLQSVLKAAARLIFKFPGRTSVTELIRSRLHWLSYPDRVTYKLCVLAYKCQHGAAPVYLSRRLVPTSVIPGRAKLRSASSWTSHRSVCSKQNNWFEQKFQLLCSCCLE